MASEKDAIVFGHSRSMSCRCASTDVAGKTGCFRIMLSARAV